MDIAFTPSAAEQVQSILVEENNQRLALRVYITGGGCAGFSYGFSLDEDIQEDDIVITTDGVNMVIDPMSYQYLTGAVIDYEKGLSGARFLVTNPNATTTCGCGSSFSI